MNGLVPKNSWRLAAHWAGLLSFAIAILTLSTTSVLASHDGPVVLVDAFYEKAEDDDGDHHFRTLQAALNSPQVGEYTVISVAAGRYVGDIELAHEGLELRAAAGPLQTAIEGNVAISARNVVISGFSLEAVAAERAVLEVSEDGLLLENSRISGAHNGVVMRGVHGATLRSNEIYDHADAAVLIEDSWNIVIDANQIRGNGWSAISIDGSHDLSVRSNSFSLNKFGGIWVSNSQRAEIRANEFDSNGIVGISLDKTSEAVVADNELRANEVGIVLVHSVGNEVLNNTILDGRTGGLVVKNDSQGNRIEGNTIRGNQGRGAIGIRLAGNVHGNDFIDNRVIENGAGLTLSENDNGSPINNLFQGNEIVFSDSSGIEIDQYAANNRFVGNDIHHNLEDGIASSGQFGIYEDNNIFDNGLAGLLLSGAINFRVEGNAIYGNGTQGISLKNTSGALLASNEVLDNLREGISIENSRQLRAIDNLVARNGGIGLNLRDVERIALLKNRVDDNSDLGVYLKNVLDVVLEENEILANANGGLRLEDVIEADIEANHLEDNRRYGLYVMNSEEIAALRNYWGDAAGPAGGFAGHGDAALGLEMESFTPWLPAAPGDLILRSVAGMVIETPEGQRIQFDASARLGMTLEFLASANNGPMGLVIAAKHDERPEIAPELEGAAGFYSLNVDGMGSGTTNITVIYDVGDLSSDTAPQELKLFMLRDGRWEALPGSVSVELRRVTGEISIDALRGALIGLGTGTGPISTSTTEDSVSPEEPVDSQPPEVERQSSHEVEEGVEMAGSVSGSSGPPPSSSSNLLPVIAIGVLLILAQFGAAFFLMAKSRSKSKDKSRARTATSTPRRRPAHVFRSWPL